MKKCLSLLGSSIVLLLASNTVSAMFIEGQIDFTGISTTADNGSVVTSIDFVSFEVNAVTGDFVPHVTPGDIITFLDLPTIVAPINLWSVAGFEFDLSTIVINALVGSTAVVEASGFISQPAYDITPFLWTYSSKRGSNTSFAATLSSDIMSQPAYDIPSLRSSESDLFPTTLVPAPAGAALLGLAILGFGLTHRKKE